MTTARFDGAREVPSVTSNRSAAGFRIVGPGEVDLVTDAMELARTVLAQSFRTRLDGPGPTPRDIENAFWALDAALRALKEKRG